MPIQTIDRGTAGDTTDKFKVGTAFDTCQANDNYLDAKIDTLDADLIVDLALKANVASPALTGAPTAPTPTVGDNDTSIATTAFVQAEFAAREIVIGPATSTDGAIVLFNGITGESLKDGPLPTAMGTAFITTANPGAITFPRANADNSVTMRSAADLKTDLSLGNVDNTSDANKPISTATQTALDLKAPLSSPAFTDNPTAPTPASGDNDTSIATTAFVQTEIDKLTVATFAALATTPATIGQIVTIAAHTSGGLGAGDFEAYAATHAATDGGAHINSATAGVRFRRINYEYLTPEMLGLIGDGLTVIATNDSAAIEATAALTNTIQIDRDTYAATTTLPEVANATFRGDGKIATIPRKQVIPWQSAGDNYDFDDLIPEKHLVQFNMAATPVVRLFGDSLTTQFANSVGRSDMLSETFRGALQDKMTNGINYFSYGIGGKTYGDFLGVAYSATITWYSPSGQTWADFGLNDAPDLMILNFGMNDSGTILTANVKNAIDYIQGWAKIPSIVMVTNLVPNPQSTTFPEGNTGNINRDKAAGFIRSYAKFRGVGLLDMHRKVCMVRDGFDPASSCLTKGDTIPFVASGAQNICDGTESCADFKVRLNFDGNALSAADYITVKTGSGANDFIQILKPTGTTVQFLGYCGDSDSLGYLSTTITYTIPLTVAYHFVIERSNGWLNVYVDTGADGGAYSAALLTTRLVYLGSEYFPRCTSNNGNVLRACDFSYGEYRKNVPSMRNDLLWGNETGSNIDEHGGSGFNHPGGYMATHVYRPMIYGARWTCPVTQRGRTAVGTGATSVTISLITPEITGYEVDLQVQGAYPLVAMFISAYTTTTFTVQFRDPVSAAAANPVFPFTLAWKVKR